MLQADDVVVSFGAEDLRHLDLRVEGRVRLRLRVRVRVRAKVTVTVRGRIRVRPA